MGWKYTEEILSDAVGRSESIAGVLRFLGIVEAGGNHSHISRSIKRLGIDTSHFTGQAWRRGRASEHRKSPMDLLVLGESGSHRVRGERLRKAFLAIGARYVCAKCGIRGVWLLEKITLHVDHVNGEYWDNRPENLRFLCPNCHAQTPTHAGKNRVRLRLARNIQQDELSIPPQVRGS